MSTKINLKAIVPAEAALGRLDRVASDLFPAFSRSRLQAWIKSGQLSVDGELRRPKDKVLGGEELEIDAAMDEVSFDAQQIPLEIVYEDAHVLVIDKPAGMVVHPGAGNTDGTMLNGLLYHCAQLNGVPRAGIVHRLDKDTSGLLVVAKTLASHNELVQQLQERSVARVYEAIVRGRVTAEGSVVAPIARNRANRTKMAVVDGGKPATTHYRVLETLRDHTHLELRLETGRTHQIRVHMQYIGYPLVGDPVYGGRQPPLFPRQALHARLLSFRHPQGGEVMSFTASLPADFSELLAGLPR